MALKKRCHYLGTEVNGKWWRRFCGDKLLTRGISEFWFDASGLFFRRYLTTIPTFIPFSNILNVKVGKWHSGRWAGGAPVVKILWKKEDKYLSSGFVFSHDLQETEAIVQKIRSQIGKTTNDAQ